METGTATVFAAVYAAVIARTAHTDDGRILTLSWEQRRRRAQTEAEVAVEQFNSYTSQE